MPVSIIIRVIISNECSHLRVRLFALVVHIRIALPTQAVLVYF